MLLEELSPTLLEEFSPVPLEALPPALLDEFSLVLFEDGFCPLLIGLLLCSGRLCTDGSELQPANISGIRIADKIDILSFLFIAKTSKDHSVFSSVTVKSPVIPEIMSNPESICPSITRFSEYLKS